MGVSPSSSLRDPYQHVSPPLAAACFMTLQSAHFKLLPPNYMLSTRSSSII